jgi:NADPH2:quinone reductase
MRAIIVTRLGGPEVLELSSAPLPEAAPGEVRVRLHATGVNFADTERRRGVYATPQLPWTPGHEGAGVVDEIGEGVSPSLLGARVAFWSRGSSGTYAESVTVPATDLFLFPASVSFAQMAALPLQGLTAWGLVHLAARIKKGQLVLVHAAAGGVGRIVVQLAVAAGARVIGTASSAEKLQALGELGATPLGYGDDLHKRVRALTRGRGADVVLDSVGRDTQAQSLASLAPFGTLMFFGEASGAPTPIVVDDLYARSVRVGAFGLDTDAAPDAYAQARQMLAAAVCDGSLKLAIAATYPLARAADAHALLESRGTIGKVILSGLEP